MIFYAHSDPNNLPPEDPLGKWQLLANHLENVAALSADLASAARPGDAAFRLAAESAGRLHDVGKYSDCFQKMIRSGTGRCQHSAHGAVLAFDSGRPDIAHAIAGHHSGIPDVSGGSGTLKVRLDDTRQEAVALRHRAISDLASLANPVPQALPNSPGPSGFDLHTRMLFSCLVDADRLDSGHHRPVQAPLRAKEKFATLCEWIAGLSATAPPGVVSDSRRQVLEDCLAAASFSERLLSLTVPTGGGKTLSAMAFALKRAELFPEIYRRVIVVIPYLSIIEQNAEVYAKVFGSEAVLEHHSGSFDRLQRQSDEHFVPAESGPDESSYTSATSRPATENWDAPVIVTTSVRFFESLFSNRPSDLRRVHNIARSIVILDEVQTLPRRLITPLLSIIRELSENWACTFVFSTATQPAFQKPQALTDQKDPRWPSGTIREIVREPARLQSALRRVAIQWELDRTATWEELSVRMMNHSSALSIVNLREHASQLFDALKSLATGTDQDSIFHLSTRMCATHRLQILAAIKSRLKLQLPCRVVSTQLIEAGVDLDFAVAFRALGPLDAILQAAGRTDRDGLLTARAGFPAGLLVVFRSYDDRTPPHEYKEATDLTGALARNALIQRKPIQPDSIDQMDLFWNRYFSDADDRGEKLQEYRLRAKFATLAREFEMINNRTLDVFVPYDDNAQAAIAELRLKGILTGELRKTLRRYTVGLQPYEVGKARGVLEEIRKDTGIFVAVDRAYTPDKGLKLELSAEDIVI